MEQPPVNIDCSNTQESAAERIPTKMQLRSMTRVTRDFPDKKKIKGAGRKKVAWKRGVSMSPLGGFSFAAETVG